MPVAPPVDPVAIEAWLVRVPERRRNVVRTALLQMRNAWQVRDMQNVVLPLVNGKTSRSNLGVTLRVLSKLAWSRPTEDLLHAIGKDVEKALTRPKWPSPMPRFDEAWPDEGSCKWRTTTETTHKLERSRLAQIFVPQHRTNDPNIIADVHNARSIVQTVYFDFRTPKFDSPEHQTKSDPSHQQWRDWWQKHNQHRYRPRLVKLQVGITFLLLQGDFSRLAALCRAKLSQVAINLAERRITLTLHGTGPRRKSTQDIHITGACFGKVLLYLEKHAFKGRKRDSVVPFLYDVRLANKRIMEHASPEALGAHLRGRGKEAGWPFPSGSRSHRVSGLSNEAARGRTAAELNRALNKSPDSRSNTSYVTFNLARRVAVARRVKGLPALPEGHRCPTCQSVIAVSDEVCTNIDCKRTPAFVLKLRRLDAALDAAGAPP